MVVVTDVLKDVWSVEAPLLPLDMTVMLWELRRIRMEYDGG
jgi:hypothetical protein